MQRRAFLASLAATIVARQAAAAPAATNTVRIGWLTAQRAASLTPYVAAMRSALAELGYVEGRNLVIEFRYGDDAIERVPALAAELIRSPVDLIVAQGAAAFEIRQLGLPVPVVYSMSADPVSAGFADSLARPRGNMTGVTLMAVEFSGKRIELLQEIVPGLERVAILGNPEHPGAHLERAFSEETARRLGLIIDYFPTPTGDELTRRLSLLAERPPQAISLLADGFAVQNRELIMDFAMRHRVPVISGWPVFAHSGAICTYGPRLTESYRRLAYYIDRILKGAKPAELPIERPTKFELVLNQRTARSLGLTFAQSLLVRADDVID
jgi:putative tryptophan/tyrosine transport system substrate-binding protein